MKKEKKNLTGRMLGILCMLLSLCASMQAKEKVVEAPCFAATNTRNLEIEKVRLGKDATWLEVKIYGVAGKEVRIDSAAVLRVAGKTYAYLGCEGMADAPRTPIPASGELPATLKFMPLPQETECFDFLEIPEDNSGWNIYGVRLDGKQPPVEIPAYLLEERAEAPALPLPAAELKRGKCVLKGRLLGYRAEYGISLTVKHADWFFPDFFGKRLRVAEDGTFCHETDLLMPGGGSLSLGRWSLNLFLMPGDTLEVTLNVPEISMSQSHLFAGRYPKAEASGRLAWFAGAYAALNEELMHTGRLMDLKGESFWEDICGMTPEAYKKYVFQKHEKVVAALENGKGWSDACRTYVRVNLDMSLFSCIKSYKHNLNYAPVFAGKGGIEHADIAVDSTTYFKKMFELEVLRSPYLKYYKYYVDLVRLAATGWNRDKLKPEEPLWSDIALGRRAAANLAKQVPMSDAERLTLDSIATPEIRQYFLDRNRKVEAWLQAMKAKEEYSIVTVDKELAADSLLQVLTRPYRGKMVLVDLWNTWCGPCMRAMESIRPLKEELKEVVYLYIADETSPEGKWKETIPDIHGIHCRITNTQSAALGKLYGYQAIPTYFIVNREGEIAYQATGFPGVEELRKRLVPEEQAASE